MACARRAGFTLLELIAVVAILTILAGVALPVIAKGVEREARHATQEELNHLAQACLEYLRDTGDLPLDAERLVAAHGVSGWSGPYVSALDPQHPAYRLDAWRRPYQFVHAGGVLTLRSGGADGVLGNGDDLVRVVDPTPVRRERTREQLRVLNLAVQAYNSQFLAIDPLPGAWNAALDRLVLRGFLPTAQGYAQDHFGSPLTGVPAGFSPLVEVGSVHVGQ
jgi:general secretion pathway protein G